MAHNKQNHFVRSAVQKSRGDGDVETVITATDPTIRKVLAKLICRHDADRVAINYQLDPSDSRGRALVNSPADDRAADVAVVAAVEYWLRIK